MPEPWELTQEQAQTAWLGKLGDDDPYGWKGVGYAARRKLLLLFIEHRNDTQEERTALFEQLCIAHGLIDGVEHA